ncbi:MAG: hypothetical protein RIQ70_323 [Bacteroidota bacterium]
MRLNGTLSCDYTQKEKLQSYFNKRKKDEFYTITRQIMTSFKMIGFPELSDQLHDFATDFKTKTLADEQDPELVAILNKIDLTLPFVESELTKLNNLPKAQLSAL